ncbi:hypothetical protein [Romboutsia sp. 13368]|nr:hypothetical protein [Romboutsia sp. 13368]
MKRNEVIDILNFRHACKEFDTSKKIDSQDLRVILVNLAVTLSHKK